jgi:hypothetical protein
MDYARFNYIAQPGDKGVLYCQMGPYDHYAVNGVLVPNSVSPEAVPTLDKWIMEKREIQCISISQQF